jgi:hypothetical protein
MGSSRIFSGGLVVFPILRNQSFVCVWLHYAKSALLFKCNSSRRWYTPTHGSTLVGSPLILLGVASGILWMSGRWPFPFAPDIALFLLLTGTTLLISKVGQLSKRMRLLLGKNVRVQVWGLDLRVSPGSRFTVDAVQPLGAGLHVYLRPVPNGSPIHLKVAQPLGTEISNAGVDISKAKYVQCAGSKIKKVEGEMALKLIVADESPHREVS